MEIGLAVCIYVTISLRPSCPADPWPLVGTAFVFAFVRGSRYGLYSSAPIPYPEALLAQHKTTSTRTLPGFPLVLALWRPILM